MLTETFSSRTLEKMKSIDQYRWRPTSDGTGRGGEAEIQSDFWPNLIFSGTNLELEACSADIEFQIKRKCLLHTDIWAWLKIQCFWIRRNLFLD